MVPHMDLVEIEAATNKLKADCSALQHNEGQCTYLCNLIESIVRSTRSANSQPHNGLLGEMYFAVKRAEILVRKCCNHHVLQVALLQSDLTQEILSLVIFMNLCDSLLHKLDVDDVKIKFGSQFHQIQLERALTQDQNKLYKKLLEQEEDGTTDDGRALAGYLLQRYQKDFTISVTNVKSYLVWKVKSKDLKTRHRLGRGGSGIVYEITWLGQRFARKDFPGADNLIFESEAALLIGLQHLNIVHTFCWSVDKQSCSLVIEFVEDTLQATMQKVEFNKREASHDSSSSEPCQRIDLHIFLRKKIKVMVTVPFDLLEAVDIMAQIALGMNYLHGKNVAHGDLKPKNILVNIVEGGRVYVKVADFGLAKSKMYSSQETHLMSVLRWRAPELLEIIAHATAGDDVPFVHLEQFPDLVDKLTKYATLERADIYSFALTCWQILTNEVPFSHLSSSDILKCVSSGSSLPLPSLPGTCPPLLKDLIQRCWHGNPQSRPTFSEICEDLKNLKVSLLTGSNLASNEDLESRIEEEDPTVVKKQDRAEKRPDAANAKTMQRGAKSTTESAKEQPREEASPRPKEPSLKSEGAQQSETNEYADKADANQKTTNSPLSYSEIRDSLPVVESDQRTDMKVQLHRPEGDLPTSPHCPSCTCFHHHPHNSPPLGVLSGSTVKEDQGARLRRGSARASGRGRAGQEVINNVPPPDDGIRLKKLHPIEKMEEQSERWAHNLFQLSCPEHRLLKMASDKWESTFEMLQKDLKDNKVQRDTIHNEIYQLIGFFIVFQSVVFMAVAQATVLHCQNLWTAVTPSALGSIVTIGGVVQKYFRCWALEMTIAGDLSSAQVLRGRIARLMFLGPSDFKFTTHARDGPEQHWKNIKKSVVLYMIVVISALLTFSAVYIAASVRILCDP